NYAKRVLNYVTIIDEMSENQKLVDDYFEIKNVESVDPWVDKGSAMDLVKSISKSEHGFTIKMDRLDRMIYVNYKTKLTNAVKDSVNPTNKIELKAESDGATSYSYVQLVGGRGDASGENKPVFELPNDAPVLDKPSINIEDIPLLPPAPILDKPELIIDIPEPKRDEPQPKQDKPNVSHGINSKPSKTTVEPQKEQVNVIYHATQTDAHALPNTGSEGTLVLTFAGMFLLSGAARIALKREGE
ncbi:LPXTG cell wall anchor domain-containing protein, partial [Collinsella aerofaciens]|nr:LPXTG cell wall anchor domain-containing protein [Collinsella aerofaciens]